MKIVLWPFVICILLIGSGCLPPPISDGRPLPDRTPKKTLQHEDTLTYSIEFFNQEEKRRFVEAFKQFIDSCHFSGLSYDSTYTLVTIKILHGSSLAPAESITTVQRMWFSEDIIQGTRDSNVKVTVAQNYTDSAVSSADIDTFLPVYGGVIRLYAHRGALDQTLLEFVVPELSLIFSDSGFCTFSDTSPQKIILNINDKIVNSRRKTISSLDLIQHWTAYIKKYPAEGLSLFSGVEGVKDFITGREALIRGFNAADQKTIQIKFDSPQLSAPTRLKTSRLFVPSLLLGPYYEENSGNEIVLLPNARKTGQNAYLDKITIKTGGDPNPVLSFSLNRYDALILNTVNDISYARTALSSKAYLHKLPSDRYFISLNIPDTETRSSLYSIVNPELLLKNYLKVEGDLIGAIASERPVVPRSKRPPSARSAAGGTLKILYRQDDGISKNIAEKLFADYSNAGIPTSLTGKDMTGYERMLVSNDYHIAIGWVTESVLTKENERLRLASMWFNNDTDEEKRLSELREIPLFSVNTYLCTRKNVHLPNGKISEIFIGSSENNSSIQVQ